MIKPSASAVQPPQQPRPWSENTCRQPSLSIKRLRISKGVGIGIHNKNLKLPCRTLHGLGNRGEPGAGANPFEFGNKFSVVLLPFNQVLGKGL